MKMFCLFSVFKTEACFGKQLMKNFTGHQEITGISMNKVIQHNIHRKRFELKDKIGKGFFQGK